MNKECYIITGTSKGIGEAIAVSLLQQGAQVIGISRTTSPNLMNHPEYVHLTADLEQHEQLEATMLQALTHVSTESVTHLILINNAAMLGPIGAIETCTATDISQSVQLGLVAPMVLSGAFIQHTQQLGIRKTILNISSGVGRIGAQDLSVYSAIKAGINRFTEAVSLEQVDRHYPVRVLAIEPGKVETAMQETARTTAGFALAEYFTQAKQKGEVITPAYVADILIKAVRSEGNAGRTMRYTEFE